MSLKVCPKCQANHAKPGTFCSRSCANSRGPRSKLFKSTVSGKLKGRTGNALSESAVRSLIASRGHTIRMDDPNTMCVICNIDTKSKKRKTCSAVCFSLLCGINSRKNPKCGGQKHTHRTEMYNINGEMFIAESSYEVMLAEILNDLGIYWIRPNCLYYISDQDIQRRYHPDFYIPHFGLYLDPKNEFLIATDVDKISRAAVQNDVKIIVIGINYITQHHIKQMIDRGCNTGLVVLN